MSELLLLLLIWYNGTHSVPLRVSPETTYITEPRTSDGKHVDYVAAFKQRLYPPEIATDANGYRLVFQHLRDAGSPHYAPNSRLTPKTLRQICLELGLDPTHKPDLVYRDFYAFTDNLLKTEPEYLEDIVELLREERRKESDSDLDSAFKQLFPNWDSEKISSSDIERYIYHSDKFHQFPVIQRYVEEYSPALDLIAEAVAKPVFFVPMVAASDERGLFAAYEKSLFCTQEARNYARGFRIRTDFRIATGDIGSAIDDILACYRLGRHFTRQGTLVASFVGISIEGIAEALAIDTNFSVPASEEQLQRLAEGIRNLPPRMALGQVHEIERFFVLDTFQAISTKKIPVSTLSAGSQLRALLGGTPTPDEIIANFILDNLGYDWNIVARQFNAEYSAAIEGTSTRVPSGRSNDILRAVINSALRGTPPQFAPADWNPLNWLASVKSRSHEMADIICDDISGIATSSEAFRRSDCCRNMKQIVLAMLIYERRHGTLPPAFSVAADGRPLHSWRVLLLPYLGDESLTELYAQINLDEPWDSEHNLPFHELNLDIYRCPSAVTRDGEASYSVIVGDDTLFGSDGNGRLLADFKRHIILLTERKEGVCWMRPDAEIPQAEAELGINSWRGEPVSISSNHTGGANFGLRDGSVHFLSETVNQDRFRESLFGSDKLPW